MFAVDRRGRAAIRTCDVGLNSNGIRVDRSLTVVADRCRGVAVAGHHLGSAIDLRAADHGGIAVLRIGETPEPLARRVGPMAVRLG